MPENIPYDLKSIQMPRLTGLQAAATDAAWQMSFLQKPTAGPYGSSWADKAGITGSYSYSDEQAASGAWSGNSA